jgi:hypothetical protein
MLWIFGDSFSTQWEKMGELGVKYSEWKGYTPKIFSNYLSTMLSTDVTQCGIGGADNHTIFDSIITNIPNMTTGDTIVIGWSHPSRFRLVKNNKWLTIHNPQPIGGGLPMQLIEAYKFMDINTIEQIRVNRMSRLYWDEIIGWSTLLTTLFHLKGIKVIFWSPFVLCTDIHLNKQLLPKDWYIGTPLNRLKDETAGLINDAHFSELGHSKLADIIYEKIVSK